MAGGEGCQYAFMLFMQSMVISKLRQIPEMIWTKNRAQVNLRCRETAQCRAMHYKLKGDDMGTLKSLAP